jgi:hypothetical protein
MTGRRLFLLAAARAEIRETPTVWPLFEAGPRRYILSGFPYRIIYREVDDSLQLVAVANHKRPGYWHSRRVA